MKVHMAIAPYEFIEFDAETPAQAKDGYEAVRAFFPMEAPSTQGTFAPSNKGSDEGKFTGTAPEGICKKCGADNVTSPKTGKVFCTAKCWTK